MSHVHASVNARPYETSEAEKFELSIPEADEPPMSGKSRLRQWILFWTFYW